MVDLGMKKVVLITGCSSGFGLTTSKYLAERGFEVVPTVRKKEDLDLLPGMVLLDVTWSQETINEVIQKIIAKYGRIDCVVNNAGFGSLGRIENSTEEIIQKQFNTNFFGTFKVIKAVLPKMKKQGGGMIINISSVLGLISTPDHGVYAASKFAVEALSSALRLEERKNNIKVVVVEPGAFKTKFYPKAENHTDDTFSPDGYGLNPVVFSKLIEKIIKSEHPKPSYIVGREKPLMILLRYLPQGIKESLLEKYFS